MAIITQKLSLEKDGIAGYLSYPKRAHRGPAILVVHHSHGLTEELRLESYDWAEMGYTVFIPNMYQMVGIFEPITPGMGQEIQKVKSDPEFLEAIRKGWDFLLARPDVDPKRVGLLSYCMGARLAMHFVAATPGVRAFAAYYPSIKEEPETEIRPRHAFKPVAEITCPTFVVFGGQDSVVSNDMQLKVWKQMIDINLPFEWHFYSHGLHGLAAPASEGNQPELARRIWPLTVGFFKRELEEPVGDV
jgi:dienelactone hydrolase